MNPSHPFPGRTTARRLGAPDETVAGLIDDKFRLLADSYRRDIASREQEIRCLRRHLYLALFAAALITCLSFYSRVAR